MLYKAGCTKMANYISLPFSLLEWKVWWDSDGKNVQKGIVLIMCY